MSICPARHTSADVGKFRRRRGRPGYGRRRQTSANRRSAMDVQLLAVTAVLFFALAVACLLPVSADGTEDYGDGRGQVVIPPPVKTPPYRPRTWIFLGVPAGLSLFFLGWRNPALRAV